MCHCHCHCHPLPTVHTETAHSMLLSLVRLFLASLRKHQVFDRGLRPAPSSAAVSTMLTMVSLRHVGLIQIRWFDLRFTDRHVAVRTWDLEHQLLLDRLGENLANPLHFKSWSPGTLLIFTLSELFTSCTAEYLNSIVPCLPEALCRRYHAPGNRYPINGPHLFR